MTTATQKILKSFKELLDPEKHEFVGEIMKWTAQYEYPPLTDEELILASEQVFLELDKEEMCNERSG